MRDKISRHRFTVIFSLLLTVALFTVYLNAFKGYFQGDEWYYFTQFLPLTARWDGLFIALYKSLFEIGEISGGGHLTPIYNMSWFGLNAIFGIAYKPYVFVSLLLHSINSIIVFILIRKLSNNKYLAVYAGIFFAFSFTHFQAVTWIMAMVPTVLALTFFLLCIIFLINGYKEGESTKSINLKISSIFFVLALLTKENTVILFVLIPVILYLFFPDKLRAYLRNVYIKILLFYTVFRFGIPMTQALLNESSPHKFTTDILIIILRIFSYPLKMLSQTFIPQDAIIFLSGFYIKNFYPDIYNLSGVQANIIQLIQGPFSEAVLYICSLILLLLIVIMLFKQKSDESHSKLVLLGLLIILSSAIPLIAVALYAPWWGYSTFLDSRHIYFASVGGGILFSVVLYRVTIHLKSRFALFVSLILLSGWLLIQVNLLQNQLNDERNTALNRKKIIASINFTLPELSKKQLILVESNTGYYGFGAIPPFQTALGQVLAVNYYQSEQLPREFLESELFRSGNIQKTGYEEIHGRGFGYFLDRKELYTFFKTQKLSQYDVESFLWDGNATELISTTDLVHSQLQRLEAFNERKNTLSLYREANYSIQYPDAWRIVRNYDNTESNIKDSIYLINDDYKISLTLHEKSKSVPFHDYVKTLFLNDGTIIDNQFSVENVARYSGDEITIVVVNDNKLKTYYIPFYDGTRYLRLNANGSNETINEGINTILTSVEMIDK